MNDFSQKDNGEAQFSDNIQSQTALAIVSAHPLVIASPPRSLDQHPAAVYLASLSVRSRRTMRGDLNTIAGLLSANAVDAFGLDWTQLRYAHCAAIRTALAERYAHTTANRMLSGLRGVLKAAWRLGQLPTEEYHRAIDLPAIKGETLPGGRLRWANCVPCLECATMVR